MFSFNEDEATLYTKRELWLMTSMYTDWKNCIVLEVGDIDLKIVDLLTNRGFDQAPVYSATDERIFGILTTERAKQLYAEKSPITPEEVEIIWEQIEIETTLEELLEILSASQAALVVEGEKDVYGMITIADLNSHSFRSLLYHPLSELEAKLAKIVENHFTHPWEWLSLLSEQHQVNLVGYWEISKRNGVDISPISSAYLSQLLTIVGKTEDLRKSFGYTSRKQFEKATGSLPELRNRVMHPIRPLILGHQDVVDLKHNISTTADMELKATEMLGIHKKPSEVRRA